jgi:hypothetical protein
MAIIERKQLTGSTAKINQYAGHEGQLVFDKTTKHLHVLSGTAGNSTKLANVSDIPAPVDISGKADKTYVDTELAKKQAQGDYATTSALTSGLAGKANSSHTHTKSQITDFPTIPDTSTLIPKTGNRGALAGWETNTIVTDTVLTEIRGNSPDVIKITVDKTVQIFNGNVGESWTKAIYIAAANVRVKIASQWHWVGNSIPTIEKSCMCILHWNDARGYVNVLKGNL